MTDLDQQKAELLGAIATADADALEAIRVSALGKSGTITALLKTLGGMSPEERTEKAPAIQGLRTAVSDAIAERKEALDSAALDAKLEEVLKQVDRCAPLANALTKAVVMKVGTEPLSSVLDFASDQFAVARRSPEAAEGLRAFAEKRPPKWTLE